MLTGSDDIADVLCPFMHGVSSVQPELHDHEGISLPERMVIKIKNGIIDLHMRPEQSSTFLFCGKAK